MKFYYSFIITIILALNGCYKQIDSSTSVINTSDLKFSVKDEISDANLYYTSLFEPIRIDEIYDLYFKEDNSALTTDTLLEPIKMIPDFKINQYSIEFNDCSEKVLLEDSIQSLTINQHYSHLDSSSLKDGIVTIYFYPVVSKKKTIKKVQMDHKKYCDGIYEIRYVQ